MPVSLDRDAPQSVVAYGAAAAFVLAALLLRLLVNSWLGPTVPYLSFFPAILLASWFGGVGPGVFAAVMSAVCADVWFLLPVGIWKIPSAFDLRSLGLFLLIGIGIAYLSGVTKKAEAAHRRTAGEWRTTLASIGDGVIVTDKAGRVLFLNAVAERLTGWTFSAALGRPLDQVFALANEDTSSPVESPVTRVLRDGTVVGLANHTVLRHRNGSSIPIADSGAPIFNTSNEVDGVVLVFRDQSAERETERALRRSQGLLQAISDNSPTITYVKDLEGRYLFVNRSFTELFHVNAQEMLGRSDLDLFTPDVAERFRSMDRRVVEADMALTEEEVVPLDAGDRIYISVKCPLWDQNGESYGIFGVSTDVTDLKRAEHDLVESRRYYQALAESLPHLVWTCRPDGYCDFLSRQWEEYTGIAAEAQLGAGWAEQLHPDDRPKVEVQWRAALMRGDLFDTEFRIRRHDGAYRWFRTRAMPLRDASGAPVKWFGSNTDVEDYKHSEQGLRAQLERLDLLDRLTRAIGAGQDLHNLLQVVARSLEDHLLLDYCCVCLYDPVDESLTVACVGARSEALARELDMGEKARLVIDSNGLSKCVRGQLVYEPDIGGQQRPFARRLSRGGIRSFVGAPLVVESSVFGVLIAARRVPAGFSSAECEFLRQLSEHVGLAAHQAQLHTALQRAYDDLHLTQQAVMQQERLKALGQMASGIAHDINNAISPVALYTESLLESETTLSTRAREYLQTIQRATDDVAQTVARMREFYRPREAELVLTPVDVNQVMHDVVNLTRARWSDMPQQRGLVIELSATLAPDAPAILGVESELREALINLVFNAIDAMPDGGTLSVRTRRSGGSAPSPADRGRGSLDPSGPDAGGRDAMSRDAMSRDTVFIEVSDTGIGMDPDTRRRCLEPFFTTKGERGTGLGLATVYGMVQRHAGEIEIDSAPGQGATVRLAFGAAPEPATSMRSAPPDYARPLRLRILVVDDDPLLLKVLRDTLDIDGHAVTVANGGQAGIDAFIAARDAGTPFSIVITDLGMPYVDGRQVSARVKQLSPSTPVVLLTGWGQRLVDDGDVPLHVDRVLNKPPKLSDLRPALAELTSEKTD